MAKDKDVATMPFLRELLQTGIYKRTQGRIARQLTFAAFAGVFVIGAWRMSSSFATSSDLVRVWVPTLIAACGAWFSFRVVNMPRFADFLISVEAEMHKVSWPSRKELVRSVIVVLLLIAGLGMILFGYDLFWQFVLTRLLQIKGVGGGG